MNFCHTAEFEFGTLETQNANGKRHYVVPGGGLYPSVTTVTGFEKAEFFKEWRAKNPQESKRVLRRGNLLHWTIEDYLNNSEGYISNRSLDQASEETLVDLFNILKPTLDEDINNIVAQEVSLYSDTLCLAGRVDCVADYKGVRSIIDFKGSTREKRDGDIENYFLQATAYAIMWQELTKQSIKQIVIAIANETGTPQIFVRNPIDYVERLKETIESYQEKFGSVTI
jgi:genome maintenance exonuclease 1